MKKQLLISLLAISTNAYCCQSPYTAEDYFKFDDHKISANSNSSANTNYNALAEGIVDSHYSRSESNFVPVSSKTVQEVKACIAARKAQERTSPTKRNQ